MVMLVINYLHGTFDWVGPGKGVLPLVVLLALLLPRPGFSLPSPSEEKQLIIRQTPLYSRLPAVCDEGF